MKEKKVYDIKNMKSEQAMNWINTLFVDYEKHQLTPDDQKLYVECMNIVSKELDELRRLDVKNKDFFNFAIDKVTKKDYVEFSKRYW